VVGTIDTDYVMQYDPSAGCHVPASQTHTLDLEGVWVWEEVPAGGEMSRRLDEAEVAAFLAAHRAELIAEFIEALIDDAASLWDR
tara:strand:- start:2043 stop:2297 length:255 start_codon:yes stop_codon:yes gene_type:complete